MVPLQISGSKNDQHLQKIFGWEFSDSGHVHSCFFFFCVSQLLKRACSNYNAVPHYKSLCLLMLWSFLTSFVLASLFLFLEQDCHFHVSFQAVASSCSLSPLSPDSMLLICVCNCCYCHSETQDEAFDLHSYYLSSVWVWAVLTTAVSCSWLCLRSLLFPSQYSSLCIDGSSPAPAIKQQWISTSGLK